MIHLLRKRFGIPKAVLLGSVVFSCVGAEETREVLYRDEIVNVLRAAQNESSAIGILLAREQLCRAVPMSDRPAIESGSLSQRLDALARSSGGSILQDKNGFRRVIVGKLPLRLVQASSEPFTSFPLTTGTAPYFAELLTGWLRSRYHGLQGFGFDVGSATDEERFTVGPMIHSNVMEIATKVVSSGGKGAWIISDSEDATSDGRKEALVSLYAYRNVSFSGNYECNFK